MLGKMNEMIPGKNALKSNRNNFVKEKLVFCTYCESTHTLYYLSKHT